MNLFTIEWLRLLFLLFAIELHLRGYTVVRLFGSHLGISLRNLLVTQSTSILVGLFHEFACGLGYEDIFFIWFKFFVLIL